MVKMIEATRAGGLYDNDDDEKISINADNVNIYANPLEDEVGNTKIIFNDGTQINIIETQEQLRILANS